MSAAGLIDRLEEVGKKALSELARAESLDALEQARVSYLGKKGALSEILKGLGSVDGADRPKVGAAANEWKRKIEEQLDARGSEVGRRELEKQLERERIDVTLPARMPHRGALHVVTQTTQRIVKIFSSIGFDVTTGPEIDTEFLNFDAVNIPADHPARDMQDTFFMGPGVVLRTHTSTIQMRAMRSQSFPVRILAPGAVYRADNDATHSPMFHQVEGLWVDRGVRMSDLKGVLAYFAREAFGGQTKIRLRPSFFPFVEPGAEVDVSCVFCKGRGDADCKVCRGSGWLEILGAGMVHPRLFELAKYPTGEVTGFAFGMGVERIAMLLHGIPDMRLLFQNDMRFLTQFGS